MMEWADSFDHYGMSETNMLDGPYAEVGTGWSLSTDLACTGTHSLLKAGITTNDLRRVFGQELSVAGVAQHIYFTALPGGNNRAIVSEFRNNANFCQVAICVESTGAIAAYAGVGGDTRCGSSRLGVSTTLLTANAWNHLECKAVIGAIDGAVEVRLNGVTVLNLAGIDTDPQNSGETAQWAAYGKANSSGPCYVDDLIAWGGDLVSDSSSGLGGFNTDFIGDKKVYTQFPDADGVEVDWTPSSGVTRYAMVDDPDPDADGTYDSAGAPTEKMGLTFPDVPSEIVSISAIVICHKSRKTDAGSCDVMSSVVSGVSQQDGANRPMTTVYTVYQDVSETDPDTDAPWTPTGANAQSSLFERTV